MHGCFILFYFILYIFCWSSRRASKTSPWPWDKNRFMFSKTFIVTWRGTETFTLETKETQISSSAHAKPSLDWSFHGNCKGKSRLAKPFKLQIDHGREILRALVNNSMK